MWIGGYHTVTQANFNRRDPCKLASFVGFNKQSSFDLAALVAGFDQEAFRHSCSKACPVLKAKDTGNQTPASLQQADCGSFPSEQKEPISPALLALARAHHEAPALHTALRRGRHCLD